MIIPNMPRAAKKPTNTETANARFLNSVKGTIGSLTRCSIMKKAISIAAPKASNPSTSKEFHPWSLATDNAISIGIRPAARVADPTKSMSRQEARVRTKGRKAATTAWSSEGEATAVRLATASAPDSSAYGRASATAA